MSSDRPVVFVGGPTGGHLLPGVALAHALVKRGGLAPHFLTGDRPIEERVLASSGFPRHRLAEKGPARARAVGRLFDEIDPVAVVALGGGAGVWPGMRAYFRRIPLFLLEQNRVVGRAQRLLLRFSRRIFLSFRDTRP